MAPPLEEVRDVANCQNWASSDWNKKMLLLELGHGIAKSVEKWTKVGAKLAANSLFPWWPWISSFLIHWEHLPIFLIKVHTGVWRGRATVFFTYRHRSPEQTVMGEVSMQGISPPETWQQLQTSELEKNMVKLKGSHRNEKETLVFKCKKDAKII